MKRYTVIAIPLRHDNPVELENKIEEVSRYFYGRSFLLYWKEPELIARKPVSLVYWLVEENYVQHIIDRLASGLFAARRATADETAGLIAEGVMV